MNILRFSLIVLTFCGLFLYTIHPLFAYVFWFFPGLYVSAKLLLIIHKWKTSTLFFWIAISSYFGMYLLVIGGIVLVVMWLKDKNMIEPADVNRIEDYPAWDHLAGKSRIETWSTTGQIDK